MIIAAFISNFADLAIVQNAFAGIQVCVVVLILNAVIKLAKKSVIDIPTSVICIAVALLSIVTDLSPIVFVIAAGVLGVVIQSLKAKGAKS